MPIQEDFCKGDKKPIGKIALDDGENFHWIWPSQGLVEASKDEKVLADYKKHKEKMVPLGITGTMVANDWVSLMVLVLRLVLYKYFNGTELTRTFQV